MAAPSFFVGRFLRLGRLLIARGFGGTGNAPVTDRRPCVHADRPVRTVSTDFGLTARTVSTTIGAPVRVVSTAITVEEC